MRKDLIRGSLAVVVFTVLLGLVYPLVMTGIAQVAFPGKADGSLIRTGRQGRSARRLLGRSDGKGDARRYFQPRPSATDYSAAVTFFANHGPNQRSTRDLTRQHLDAYLDLERPYNPGPDRRAGAGRRGDVLGVGRGPAHLARPTRASRRTASPRSAASRSTRVNQLIDDNTDGRGLGLFGEPGVNVTKLNLALDQEAR